ncbi:MAG: DUF5683 domain-containing protein [bacterium]
MKTVILFIFVILSFASSYADDTEPVDSIPPVEFDTIITDSSWLVADTVDTASAILVKDTILFIQSNTMDPYTLVNDTTNFENRLIQNPTKALFKSMLIPGWGQYGNKKYFKAALYAALDVWLISNAIKYGGEASDYFKQYENDTTIAGRNEYYGLYENKKDSRNKYTWFAVIVSFISMFDAYVDAHLSGFPEKSRFSNFDIDVQYDHESGVKAAVRLPFNP